MEEQVQERIVRDRECLEITGVSAATRWRLEQVGRFPKRRQISPGLVGWLFSELVGWMRSRPPGPSAKNPRDGLEPSAPEEIDGHTQRSTAT